MCTSTGCAKKDRFQDIIKNVETALRSNHFYTPIEGTVYGNVDTAGVVRSCLVGWKKISFKNKLYWCIVFDSIPALETKEDEDLVFAHKNLSRILRGFIDNIEFLYKDTSMPMKTSGSAIILALKKEYTRSLINTEIISAVDKHKHDIKEKINDIRKKLKALTDELEELTKKI